MARTQELGGDQVGPIDEIQFGLHAERPTNPLKGWVWISRDVKKFFVCFADNVWTHCNPVDLTGAQDGDFFGYDGITGFLIPKTVKGLQYGLEDDLPEAPEAGDVYLATDTEIVYYCFIAGLWSTTFLPRNSLQEFEHDTNDDIMPYDYNAIFEIDGEGGLMPTLAGTNDAEFEIVGDEITPKV